MDSPTAIIWVTMGGKTSPLASGSAIVSPSLILVRAFMIAYSIGLFPAVFEVIVKPSKIGTPLVIKVERVLENRATATFRNRIPNTGDLRTRLSIVNLPFSVA